MSSDRFDACVVAGRRAVAVADADLVAVGEMGIGSTTTAAAVSAALFGGPVHSWVGRGSGIDDPTLERKTGAVARAVCPHRRGNRPFEILQRVGGAELAAIAGAIV